MQHFKKLNTITGWITFGIAFLTYLFTVEPTASFWDCGEFIAASYKLQVPHPPGAPFFLLVNRMFSFLALGDVTRVAYWINISSVLFSAFTILFLFWSITRLGTKLLPKDKEGKLLLSKNNTYSLMAAGFVGALAFTFSDSFWFSAVEAEVYAMSSFFTAFVFWAMLKWEWIEEERRANKWLILIAYMIGLSIGVHLLNLVAIPVLGLIFYYKKYQKVTSSGVIVTLLISCAIIIFVMSGIIPGLPSLAGSFEIFFVNSIGLPFGSGIIFFLVLSASALIGGLIYSVRSGKLILNTALLSLTFILIGYLSYGIILIRSQYNPPIDENDPENILSFVYYLKREQYGNRPLLYGPKFNAEVTERSKGSALYRKDKAKGKYVVFDYQSQLNYDENILFPRIYSREGRHVDLYRSILGLKEGQEPGMRENVYFFLKHQLGHMYWRYFFWNFVGRAGDIQDDGVLGPFESDKDVPELVKENMARNQFYALPFILGLLGAFFQYSRSKKSFLVTTLLFFLTGIALIIYLNSPPSEPRERDYIYVGSFYAFAIWIGLGAMYIITALNRIIKNKSVSTGIGLAVCLVVPGIMAAEGWDDHDRSGRYHSVDSAKNLLNSCEKNAILFTGGDNDTFPLWYVQEVEGFRTDVRVCNLSLLGTDWYIKQMKQKAYESDPLPISLDEPQYRSGRNDQIIVGPLPSHSVTESQKQKILRDGILLKDFLKYLNENHPAINFVYQPGDSVNVMPSPRLHLMVDTNAVLNMDIIPENKKQYIVPEIDWDINRNNVFKSDLMMLDIIATNNWKRPIYFSSTLSESNYLNLMEYMHQEGLAYRLLPAKIEGASNGSVSTQLMYRNMMKDTLVGGIQRKMYWRGLDNPSIYYDENYRRFPANARSAFITLAKALLKEGKREKAKETLLYCLKTIPDEVIPFDMHAPEFIAPLIQLGEEQSALEISEKLSKRAVENIKYYFEQFNGIEIRRNLYILRMIANSLEEAKHPDQEKYEQLFINTYKQYEEFLK